MVPHYSCPWTVQVIKRQDQSRICIQAFIESTTCPDLSLLATQPFFTDSIKIISKDGNYQRRREENLLDSHMLNILILHVIDILFSQNHDVDNMYYSPIYTE